jgi:hypothetical protein
MQQPTRFSAAHPGVVKINVFSATVFGAACTRPAAASRQQTANSATADLPVMSVHPSASWSMCSYNNRLKDQVREESSQVTAECDLQIVYLAQSA